MVIFTLFLSVFIVALWSGIDFFYSMVEVYVRSTGESGGEVLKYLPYVKHTVFFAVVVMLLIQAYQMRKRVDKEKPSI